MGWEVGRRAQTGLPRKRGGRWSAGQQGTALRAFRASCRSLCFMQLSGRPSGLARCSVAALHAAENGFTVTCPTLMFKALQGNLQVAALGASPSKDESSTCPAVPRLRPQESSSREFLSPPAALHTRYQQDFASSPKLLLLLPQTPNSIPHPRLCLPAVLRCCHSWSFFSVPSFTALHGTSSVSCCF